MFLFINMLTKNTYDAKNGEANQKHSYLTTDATKSFDIS